MCSRKNRSKIWYDVRGRSDESSGGKICQRVPQQGFWFANKRYGNFFFFSPGQSVVWCLMAGPSVPPPKGPAPMEYFFLFDAVPEVKPQPVGLIGVERQIVGSLARGLPCYPNTRLVPVFLYFPVSLHGTCISALLVSFVRFYKRARWRGYNRHARDWLGWTMMDV